MRNLITAFLLSLSLLSVFPAHAAPLADTNENKTTINGPETATFQLPISNNVEINSIVLEDSIEQQTYGELVVKATLGFRINGLEVPRRQAVVTQPSIASIQLPPTFVPTPVSILGKSFALQVMVTPIPTSTIDGQTTQDTPPAKNAPPLSLTLTLLALCCAMLLVIGVFVLGFVARTQNLKEGKIDN